VVFLDRKNGTLHIGQPDSNAPGGITERSATISETETQEGNNVRLSPKVRENPSSHDAIPSIPAKIIAPFLSQPLIIESDALKDAPALIGAREGRVILGKNDTGFVKGLPADKGEQWQIYRPGKTFIDPDSGEELGIEAIYLGNAEVTRYADISTIAITHSVQEIYAGDRLVVPSADEFNSYLPRAPESKISSRVISVYGGVTQGGQNSVITINKGRRDGLEVGHVLALYRKGEDVKVKSESILEWDETYSLPDERYGLIFVFRVFNKVSYALVMQTKLPVQLLDSANTP
jgi:hypothetical protein